MIACTTREMFSFVRVDRVDRLSLLFFFTVERLCLRGCMLAQSVSPYCRAILLCRVQVCYNLAIVLPSSIELVNGLILLVVLPVALYQLSVCDTEYVLV